ncbi:MAG: glycosyltransferase [Pirellulales bacterium]|nr:glycosyltransferase [Pirellulales bacterium]
MSATVVAAIACCLAVVPAMVFLRNLGLYRVPAVIAADVQPRVSVLIPARNEEPSIGAAVESALASRGVVLEVIVLDDHSTDRTAEIVDHIAARDSRVRCVSAPPLPDGWCGKQHACSRLAELAAHDWFVFVDADVRLAPDGLARAVAFVERQGVGLASGIPRQETGTALERLVLPLIHFLLLGYLPLWRMRRSRHPAYAAGCGQLFVTDRVSYRRAGGHAAIRASLHDGITLPRAYRSAGLGTDLFDATPLATCRMYRSAAQVWSGLAKNATEGLAAPGLIAPITVLLVGGQIVPPILLLLGVFGRFDPLTTLVAAAGTVAAYLPRAIGVRRFGQSFWGACAHPLGVALLLAIQWWAFGLWLVGRRTAWKDRVYAPHSAPDAAAAPLLQPTSGLQAALPGDPVSRS